MLNRLLIKNYALIDQLDINLSAGLNMLTGETGAGKSIILGALSLILGQRAESKYFFNQEKKCVIEGFFDIKDYLLKDYFDEFDLDYEDETILRREITADGKSRAFINDTPVNLSILKGLGERLIAIHSQHATLEINTEEFQFMTLDSVGNNTALLAQYQETFKQYKETHKQLIALEEEMKQAQTEADYHQFLFDELASAKLAIDEQEELEQEQNQLSHAEEIKRSLLSAHFLLSEQDQPIIQALKEALQQIQQAERFVPHLKELTERLQSSLIEIKDIAEEIEQTERGVLFDEERLIVVNDRLSLLFQLQQKHHVSQVADLIQIREEINTKLAKQASNDEELTQLTIRYQQLEQACQDLAAQLHQSREKAIPIVQKEVTHVLHEVGMPNSTLQIQLAPASQLRAFGSDTIQFLFSANKGMQPQPMSKVASGGELSRLMLSIKSLVAKTTALPTMIFDEIDTGISGEVALKVGQVMEDMAQYLQVIAITHLPQIASKGNTHYQVYKTDTASITRTHMRQLTEEERVIELAQMLSGSNPGEAAIQHAKELLKKL